MTKSITKIFLCSFFAIACSCSKEIRFPDLYVDPMIAAYKENHIDHYKKYTEWKGILIAEETVYLNECGLPVRTSHISGTLSGERFEYDSLCRVIEYRHDNDIHFKAQYHYRLVPEANRVLQYEGKDTTNARIFQYNEDFGRLICESGKRDIFENIVYEYSGDKIKAIIKTYREIPDHAIKTEFVYNKKGKLKIIRQPEGETAYVSEKTGLIDSVVTAAKEDRVYYKYFKRK